LQHPQHSRRPSGGRPRRWSALPGHEAH
jgi:hypothetical protein